MFGNVVRTLRKERGWSRERLARESGISESTVERVENGLCDVGLGNAQAIARALGYKFELVERGDAE